MLAPESQCIRKMKTFHLKSYLFAITCMLTAFAQAGNLSPAPLSASSFFTSADTSDIIIPVENLYPERISKGVNKNGWNKLTLPKRDETLYIRTTENNRPAVKAMSTNSASGFMYPVNINPRKYPIMEWEWKIEKVLEKGDMSVKDGDDYAARIYVNFRYSRNDLPLGERIKYSALKTFTSYDIPLRSINYVWANKAEKGTVAKNAYTGWVHMVAVASGNDKAGEWVTVRMNILEDYRNAFGEEPREIIAVSLMTDSDNTGDSSVAWYRNVVFKADPSE